MATVPGVHLVPACWLLLTALPHLAPACRFPLTVLFRCAITSNGEFGAGENSIFLWSFSLGSVYVSTAVQDMGFVFLGLRREENGNSGIVHTGKRNVIF